ncbi:MAG: hypothetical protein AAGE84_05095 [Cyanobacteria bacterium P01_G01_bin.39]
MQTEIQVTKIELRKIYLEFERVASRLLETKWKQGISNLKRFMTFIDNNKVINKFIQEHSKYYFEEVIYDSDGLGIVPDDSKSHEISYVYQLLTEELEKLEGCENDRKEAGYALLASAFARQTNMQTKVDNFNIKFSDRQPLVMPE